MQSLEKKSKSVYQIQYKKCVYVSLGKASISCLFQKWVCTLKSVCLKKKKSVCFLGELSTSSTAVFLLSQLEGACKYLRV